MANDNPEPDAYPTEWGYQPRQTGGALEAAFDIYASQLSDDDFAKFVERVRPAGSH